MGDLTKKRRRRLGVFFLLAALGMLVAGETLFRDHFSKLGFVVYWLACFAFTFLAMIVAWFDALAIRQNSRAEQREFLEETFREIERKRHAAGGMAKPPTPRSGEPKQSK